MTYTTKTVSTDDCWLWASAAMGGRGHGRLVIAGAGFQAHRVMYENMVGEIPEGLELDHLCENPPCINPAHLEPVPHRVNTLRHYRNKTHCKRGHPYSEFGYTRLRKSNISASNPTGESRYCRACRRMSKRRYLEKSKQTA